MRREILFTRGEHKALRQIAEAAAFELARRLEAEYAELRAEVCAGLAERHPEIAAFKEKVQYRFSPMIVRAEGFSGFAFSVEDGVFFDDGVPAPEPEAEAEQAAPAKIPGPPVTPVAEVQVQPDAAASGRAPVETENKGEKP